MSGSIRSANQLNELIPTPKPVIPEVIRTARAVAVRSPFHDRREIREVPVGMSVADIMDLFAIKPEMNARVFLNGEMVLPAQRYSTVIEAGNLVTIRVIPQPPLIIAGIIAAAEAAAAAAASAAAAVGGIAASIGAAIGVSASTVTAVAGALAASAIGMVGSLIMKALVPPPTPQGPQFTTNPARFSISGGSNVAAPFSVIPKVYGARLIHPMQAATPYTEVVGPSDYLRQLFVLGYGPLDLSAIKLNDALLENFEAVEWEMRAGYPDDAPPTLYTGSVAQDDLNILLLSTPGNVLTYTGFQQQTSGTDADELSVDISWPGGLMSVGNGNGAHNPMQVSIQIQYAPTGTTSWTVLPTFIVSAATSSPVKKNRRWQVPNGQYDVQVRAFHGLPYKGDVANAMVCDTYWSALRTIRDRSAFSMNGLALLAVRIRATHQLNGAITNLNLIASSILPDWNGMSWSDRAGSWEYDWDNTGAGGTYGIDSLTPHTTAAKTGANWITNELFDTADGSSTTYSHGLTATTIQPASFSGSTGRVPFVDDGLGNIHADADVVQLWKNVGIGSYQPGDTVRFGGIVYLCILTNANHPPPNATYWVVAITAGTIDYTSGVVSITLGNAVGAANGVDILCSYTQLVMTAGAGKALTIRTAAGTDGAAVACKILPVHVDPVDQEDGSTKDKITTEYTVSGWYKASQAIAHGIRLRVTFSTSEDFEAGDVNNISTVDVIANGGATTSWQQATATVTAPAPPSGLAADSSFFMRVIAYHNPDGVGGVTVSWDDIAVVRANGHLAHANSVPNGSFDFLGAITSNPASHLLDVLQGKANKFPLDTARIDMSGIEDWHDWCRDNHRSNNDIVDTQTTVFEALKNVASMGRASFAMKDGLYSILQDLPQTTPVQHFTPRNSWGFKSTRAFPVLPGMLKVRFVNAGANYQSDERYVFDDGYTASTPNLVTEVLDLTHGCTDPDQAWRDGRYHMAQARLRPEIYEINVDFENIVCTRGDLVYLSHDVIEAGLGFGRIKGRQFNSLDQLTSINLDENFTFEYGNNYVARSRPPRITLPLYALINRAPVGGTYTTDLLEFTPGFIAAGDPIPDVGDLVIFGLSGSETLPMVVTKIMPGKDLTATLQLQDYSAAIYTADSGTPPPFDYGQAPKPPVPAPVQPPEHTGGPIFYPVSRSDDMTLIKTSEGFTTLKIQHALDSPVDTTTGAPLPASMFQGIEVQHRRSLGDGTNGGSAWSSISAYGPPNTVTYNGQTWMAFQSSTNKTPGTFDGSGNPYWTLLSQDEPWSSSIQPMAARGALAIVKDVVDGVSYDTRMRYVLQDGTFTPWTYVTNHTVLGQTSLGPDTMGYTVAVTAARSLRGAVATIASPTITGSKVFVGQGDFQVTSLTLPINVAVNIDGPATSRDWAIHVCEDSGTTFDGTKKVGGARISSEGSEGFAGWTGSVLPQTALGLGLHTFYFFINMADGGANTNPDVQVSVG